MKVAAVVVSHGHPRELEESLPVLREQVDELVVIANIPGSVPEGVDAVHNEQSLGFGANVNKGAALTTAELVLSANPDAVPEPTDPLDKLHVVATSLPDAKMGEADINLLNARNQGRPNKRRPPEVGATRGRDAQLRVRRRQ